jgi:hypothetical protein
MPGTIVQPPWRASARNTALVVDGLGWLVLGGLVVAAIVMRALHRHREKLAHRSALTQHAALHLGPTVLAGRVVDGDGCPVVVEIEQQGFEWKDKNGGWHHRWREQRRQLSVKPFYVARPSGERVRVEPDDQVVLVDRLDPVEPHARDFRIRRAQLEPGEHVFILGGMTRGPDPRAGGYRESGENWILKPPRTGRMLISTEPLEDRHWRRARTWRNLAWLALAGCLAFQALPFGVVNALAFTGRTVEATLVTKEIVSDWVRPKNGRPYLQHHHLVLVRTADGRLLRDEVGGAYYQSLAPGDPVTFLVSKVWPSLWQVGMRPCASIVNLILSGIAAGLFIVFLLVRAYTTRPWWERRVVDRGSGRLEARG